MTHSVVEAIAEILKTYAKASSQSINMEKCLVYFSSNTPSSLKQEIMGTPGVEEVDRFESFLGLPILNGHAKCHTFYYLKDRVWKDMLLSRAGKEVLIKAVAQSIPIYTIGVFQVPMKLCDELNAMCAKFGGDK